MDAATPQALTLDCFAGLCGERFALQYDASASLWTELLEAQALPQPPFNGRQPFSLVFNGPPGPVLPQRVYRLAHERLPVLDIFLVPIAASATGVRYQAVFN
jgi:hypothetical protein